MIRSGIKPGFRIGLDLPLRNGYRRVMPFRRSWKAIVLLLVLDCIFMLPAWAVAHQAIAQWTRFEDLFDLVTAIFLSAWLLGWSLAPILMTAALVVLLFGREVVRATEQRLELFIGLPLIGLAAVYDVAAMRNLQSQQAPQKSGRSWRGTYLSFDYGANQVEFGSSLNASDAASIRSGIESASGVSIRKGPATEAELQGEWEAKELLKFRPAARQQSLAPTRLGATYGWSSPSSLLLVIANLVPLAGAAFLGWSLADVMVLYWCESAIIGFFNLCKLIAISRWAALFIGTFFVAHYGAFMAVHFLFIYFLFVQGGQPPGASGGDLQSVTEMFVILWPALLALFVSHAYSFLVNFLGHREFESKSMSDQMNEPYKRIIFMHLVLIFGGWIALAMGNPTAVLVLVIALKIWADVRAHVKEHAPDVA
jgi:hypothetical protein